MPEQLELDYGTRTLCFTSADGGRAAVDHDALVLTFKGVMARGAASALRARVMTC